MTDTIKTHYYVNGSTSSISNTNYDWGVFNAIYNPKTQTTDAPGTWRTLTKNEWVYLLNTRITLSGIRYAKANVHGVNGLIIVPDTWLCTYPLLSPNVAKANYTVNTINDRDWAKMENAGCIFLPATGSRNGTLVTMVDSYGRYWSASFFCDTQYGSQYGAYLLGFTSSSLNAESSMDHSYGRSVRLVKDVE